MRRANSSWARRGSAYPRVRVSLTGICQPADCVPRPPLDHDSLGVDTPRTRSDRMGKQGSMRGGEERQLRKQMVVVKGGAGEALRVMGAQVKFLCTSDKTDQAWSLMEVALP